MSIIAWINRMFMNYPRLRQVSSLFAVNIIAIPISIVSNIFMTRFLGPEAYGDYKFLFYVFSFAMVVFTFGFYQAGNRAIVLSSDREKIRELYGSMLVVLSGLFIIMFLFLLIYAFVDHNISEKGLRSILIMLIPFSWIFLLTNYFEVLFQADNRINLLAKSRLYPKLLFFIATLTLYLVFGNYHGDRLIIIWILFLAAHITGFLYIIFKINPSFKNIRPRIKEILYFNKTYGFNVYIGTLFNVALNSLSGMLISYFGVNNMGVGFYGLALTIAEPLNFVPNVIATTHYKDFASRKNIEKKLTKVTFGISILTLALCCLLVGPFIRIFYGKEFIPVIYLTYIVSAGVIFNGLGDYYNRFLGAHGQGKALRNSAILVGIVLFICNFTLIPFFGQDGAAVTRILSGVTYFGCMYWFYRRLVRKLNEPVNNDIPEKLPA
ncbi:MAG TPA: oligosaccharide flippase family protein [Bacteroidales bacterium]|nr:oligosaccharide flippase family protein [Bacteroidales bacterium]